jgi:hypothetical protein
MIVDQKNWYKMAWQNMRFLTSVRVLGVDTLPENGKRKTAGLLS